jgi:hypothetical protein
MKVIWRTAACLLALSGKRLHSSFHLLIPTGGVTSRTNEALEIINAKNGLRLIDHGLIRLDHTVQDVDDVGIQAVQATPVEQEDPLITPAPRLEIRDTDEADAAAISQGALAIAVLVVVSGASTSDMTVYSLDDNYIIGGTTVMAGGSDVTIAGNAASLNANGFIIASETFAPTDSPAAAPSSPASGTAPVVQGSSPSSVVFSPNPASGGSAPSGASVQPDGSAPTGAVVVSGGSAPTGAVVVSGGSAPTGASAASPISLPASLPTLATGSGNGSIVQSAATTVAPLKQAVTAFAQFSDQSLIANESPKVMLSLPLVGIAIGAFVFLLA